MGRRREEIKKGVMKMFPKLTNSIMMERLEIPAAGKLSMVLDTDTYNEIDDQFALAYALLSGERLNVEAVYAAPFHNERSVSPGDGMEKSYEEILRVLERMQVEPGGHWRSYEYCICDSYGTRDH